jgi:hypothetical protein
MKTFTTSALIAAACFFCVQLHAGTVNKPVAGKPAKTMAKKEVHRACLEVSGSASIYGKRMKDVTILLYKGDRLIHTLAASKKEVNNFLLEENTNYTLRFTKPGCADRLICIDTHIPEGIDLSPLFHFDFDLDMIPESEIQNKTIADFPAGLIYYDTESEKFETSATYSESLKSINHQPVNGKGWEVTQR